MARQDGNERKMDRRMKHAGKIRWSTFTAPIGMVIMAFVTILAIAESVRNKVRLFKDAE